MSNNRPLTPREKQYTVLPNETAPEHAFTKASQAVSKALADIKKNTPVKKRS